MRILRRGFQGIAVIDPAKACGEPGQYVKHVGTTPDLERIVAAARREQKEIRYYYKDLATAEGELVASQVIVTEIPPGHAQPFHTHEKLHEVSLVSSGRIIAIDSDDLSETDPDAIMKRGTALDVGDVVIEEPGTRHTIMNPGPDYAVLTTIQTARIPLAEFPKDWKR